MAGNGHPKENEVGEVGNVICTNIANLTKKLKNEEAKETPNKDKIRHYQSQINSCKKGLERKTGNSGV